MEPKTVTTCTAFDHSRRVASGTLREVATRVKEYIRNHPKAGVLIFDDETAQPVEIDFRGTLDAVLERLQPAEEIKHGPGRPKLGVIAREVTLLPQHWEWLSRQPGGASVTLRKLVDDARRKNQARDRIRLAQEATHRFMTAMAGDLANYEEALRALYAKDQEKFTKLLTDWPEDLREHALKLATPAF